MISLILVVALIGLICWAVAYFIPMPPRFITGVYVLGGIMALLYVLNYFGVVFPRLK